MLRIYLLAACVGGVTVVSGGFLASRAADAGRPSPNLNMTPLVDLRVRTDAYLVPAHVCANPDDEKFADCVPWVKAKDLTFVALPDAL